MLVVSCQFASSRQSRPGADASKLPGAIVVQKDNIRIHIHGVEPVKGGLMRRSQLVAEVGQKFRLLSRSDRQRIHESALFDHDSAIWQRCRVILNLVRGHSSTRPKNRLDTPM